MQEKPIKAWLALEDGTIQQGLLIGKHGTTGGELCFNTSMIGYQEIFTDPSYYGQLMMMTYPHIGNYGASSIDDEARHPMVAGVIVRAYSLDYSNPNAESSLDEYLKRHKITGITGIDTRTLVRHIRTKGVMNAVISSEIDDSEALIKKAQDWVSMDGLELATKATRKEAQTIASDGKYKVAVMDYGIKQSIINNLKNRGCTLRIFPASASYDEVSNWNPDGFFLSNGPGDPRAVDYTFETVTKIMSDGRPVFGICMGHQLMALSQGISVNKMFVGHRGANQPVKNIETGLVEITTQNHGFAVDATTITPEIATISHLNLNDETIEGLRFSNSNAFSVQYHPEASPGPHDSAYLFDQFTKMMSTNS